MATVAVLGIAVPVRVVNFRAAAHALESCRVTELVVISELTRERWQSYLYQGWARGAKHGG